jgi:hypothetical protein
MKTMEWIETVPDSRSPHVFLRALYRATHHGQKAFGLAILVYLSFAVPALAQDSPLQIHGFGGWSFGRTDHNNLFLGGLPQGNFRRADFSLNLEDKVSDRFRVVVQSDWSETENGHDTELDYAFAEWRFSDKLRILAGVVKLPFGIYTEIIDVGTLRPFLNPPQGVYGPVGIVGEQYSGVGISGNWSTASPWSYGYDLYAGGMSLQEFRPPEDFLRGQPVSTTTQPEEESTRDVIGGRFVVHTPFDGLEFGVSANTGTLIAAGSPRRSVVGAHVSYLVDRWSIRSEWASEHSSRDVTARGYYLEPAYRIDRHWQVAAQYNDLETSIFGVPNPPASSFLSHREDAVGLNYWLTPQFVFKTSFHHVNGNRFAGPTPETYASLVAAGRLQRRTSLFQFGVNFSF